MTKPNDWATYTVARDDEPDLRFEGRLMAEVDSRELKRGDKERGRWTELRLWQLRAGGFVCQQLGRSDVAGEVDRSHAKQCDGPEDVFAVLGYTPLAKALYRKAGLEPVHVIETEDRPRPESTVTGAPSAELMDLLRLGHESPGVEFKGPCPCVKSDHQTAKIIRAMLAMANRRGGGHVVVGVREAPRGPEVVGLLDADLRTWSHDLLAGVVSGYADPFVSFTVTPITGAAGEKVAIIRVAEFETVPVQCARDFPGVLRKGVFYVRGKGRMESVEAGSAELRDLMELATEKRLRGLMSLKESLGSAQGETDDDPELFSKERTDFEPRPITTKIQERGYWAAVVRPERFNARRIANFADLLPLANRLAIQDRGWMFPVLNPNARPRFGTNWVGQDIDAPRHVETWRLYQSGQLMAMGAFTVDWEKEDPWTSNPRMPGSVLPIRRSLWIFDRVFRYAAAHAVSPAGDERLAIGIGLYQLNGRELWLEDEDRAPLLPMVTQIQDYPQQDVFTRAQLAAEHTDLAAKWATEVFRRFDGWDPPMDLLRSLLEQR